MIQGSFHYVGTPFFIEYASFSKTGIFRLSVISNLKYAKPACRRAGLQDFAY